MTSKEAETEIDELNFFKVASMMAHDQCVASCSRGLTGTYNCLRANNPKTTLDFFNVQQSSAISSNTDDISITTNVYARRKYVMDNRPSLFYFNPAIREDDVGEQYTTEVAIC